LFVVTALAAWTTKVITTNLFSGEAKGRPVNKKVIQIPPLVYSKQDEVYDGFCLL
jgi:hypothetical protein